MVMDAARAMTQYLTCLAISTLEGENWSSIIWRTLTTFAATSCFITASEKGSIKRATWKGRSDQISKQPSSAAWPIVVPRSLQGRPPDRRADQATDGRGGRRMLLVRSSP
jgi:hypothetical protein